MSNGLIYRTSGWPPKRCQRTTASVFPTSLFTLPEVIFPKPSSSLFRLAGLAESKHSLWGIFNILNRLNTSKTIFNLIGFNLWTCSMTQLLQWPIHTFEVTSQQITGKYKDIVCGLIRQGPHFSL